MDHIDDYLNHLLVERGLSGNTVEAYSRDLARFFTWLGERDEAEVTLDDLRGFMEEMRAGGLGARSLARVMSGIRGYYRWLVEENRRRSRHDPEFELTDTGVFDENRYFDVFAEYAKADPDDIFIRLTVINRGPVAAPLHLLPTLWYRNTWVWGCRHEGCWIKPRLALEPDGSVSGDHVSFGKHRLVASGQPEWWFTENETNTRRLWGVENWTPYVKDAFHEYLIHGRRDAIHPRQTGTKAAAHYRLRLPPGGQAVVTLRLSRPEAEPQDAPAVFAARRREADEFFAAAKEPKEPG